MQDLSITAESFRNDAKQINVEITLRGDGVDDNPEAVHKLFVALFSGTLSAHYNYMSQYLEMPENVDEGVRKATFFMKIIPDILDKFANHSVHDLSGDNARVQDFMQKLLDEANGGGK